MRLSVSILIILSFLCHKRSNCQDTTKIKNTFFTEILGTGFHYSLNYERLIFAKTKPSICLRIGLNWHPFTPKWTGGSEYIAGVNFKKTFGNKWSIVLGGYGVAIITYSPIPTNKTEIEFARNNPNEWGKPFNPFFQFSFAFEAGVRKCFKKNKFIGLSCTPHYMINFGIYKSSFLTFWGGINFGKSF